MFEDYNKGQWIGKGDDEVCKNPRELYKHIMFTPQDLFGLVKLEFFDGNSIELDTANSSNFTPIHYGFENVENEGLGIVATCYTILFPKLKDLTKAKFRIKYPSYIYFHNF